VKAFVCVGLAIIFTLLFVSIDAETGWVFGCDGQPCTSHPANQEQPQ